MKELTESFRQFLRRDLIYIIGGSTVIYTFLYKFNQIHTFDLPIPIYIFIAGISYVIGIASQEFFALIFSPVHVACCVLLKLCCKSKKNSNNVTIENKEEQIKKELPCSFIICLFEKWSGKQFSSISKIIEEAKINDFETARIEIYKDGDDFINAEIERIVSLMHIGSVMGPCFIVDAIFLFWRFFLPKAGTPSNIIDIWIAVVSISLGIFLLIYKRLQNVQHLQYIIKSKIVINSPEYKKTNNRMYPTAVCHEQSKNP